MIDFGLSAAERDLRARVRAFAAAEIEPRREFLDRNDHFPLEIFEAAFEAGLMTAHLPADLGGGGYSTVDLALAAEEVAYQDAGVATSLFVGILPTTPIDLFGTAEQRERWLRPLTGGPRFAAMAWTEPDGSSSLFFRPGGTTAQRVDGGYLINGTKCFITNGSYADFVLLLAYSGPKLRDLSAFIVPTDAPGVRITTPYQKLGQRASNTARIEFENVLIDETQLLGEEGRGAMLALAGFCRSRAGVCAMAAGVAQAALDQVVAWGNQRRTGDGRPLVLQQDYRFRIAELETQVELARLMAWRAAWEIDHGKELPRWSSMAKLAGGGIAARVTAAAVEMKGGHGYMEDGRVEKLMRDAKLFEIYEGPIPIQKMLIAQYATKLRRGRRRHSHG